MAQPRRRLPNAERAVITADKLRHYLLNVKHPEGGSKARFLAALGYHRRRWRLLRRALKELAAANPVVGDVKTPYGRKYTVSGILEGSEGRSVRLTTIWIVLRHEDAPRLVTAYPEQS